MENFKKELQQLSTLNHKVQIPLIDEADKYEYWKYLTQFKKSRNEADGLLHFVSDFYLNVRDNQSYKTMSKGLKSVTVQIKQILMEMSDELNKMNE